MLVIIIKYNYLLKKTLKDNAINKFNLNLNLLNNENLLLKSDVNSVTLFSCLLYIKSLSERK